MDSESTARRAAIAAAGAAGDEDAVRRGLGDAAGSVRAGALTALARMGAATSDDVLAAGTDADAAVRRTACELSPSLPGAAGVYLALLADEDDLVAEAAAFALGELGDRNAVPVLAAMATGHHDLLCREAAVAALGAIGDGRGLEAVLSALQGPPALRRRGVVALAAFDGEPVEAALRRALEDRDWQVRQAAAGVLGVSAESWR